MRSILRSNDGCQGVAGGRGWAEGRGLLYRAERRGGAGVASIIRSTVQRNEAKFSRIYTSIMVSSATAGLCEEKKRLLDLYEEATKEYSRHLNDARSRMATSSKSVYENLLRKAEDARKNSESARLALQRHVDKHGCLTVECRITAGFLLRLDPSNRAQRLPKADPGMLTVTSWKVERCPAAPHQRCYRSGLTVEFNSAGRANLLLHSGHVFAFRSREPKHSTQRVSALAWAECWHWDVGL